MNTTIGCPIPGASQPKEPVRLIEAREVMMAVFGDENDLIRRGDALKAIRKACISAHLPFDSATPEGQRVMEALYAVWKVQKEGKTHDSI